MLLEPYSDGNLVDLEQALNGFIMLINTVALFLLYSYKGTFMEDHIP